MIFRSTWKRFFLGVLLTVCLFCCGVFIHRILTSSVLLTIPNIESCCDDPPPTVILNPFRDHSPEIIVENFLNNLKSGDCETAVAQTLLNEYEKKELCSKQSLYRVIKWSEAYREDKNDIIKLVYWQWYATSKHPSHFTINLQKNNETFSITGIGFVYQN